jgi:hypothetical protein
LDDHIRVVESNIETLRPSGFFEKHDVVSAVADIKELPYHDYGALRQDLLHGRAIVRLSPFGSGISSGIFSLFATSGQKRLFTFLSAFGFLAAATGIGLAVFGQGWWWLALILTPIFTLKRGKHIYSNALFRAVGNSEKAFCFAFCGNIVTLETSDGKIRSRGQEPV